MPVLHGCCRMGRASPSAARGIEAGVRDRETDSPSRCVNASRAVPDGLEAALLADGVAELLGPRRSGSAWRARSGLSASVIVAASDRWPCPDPSTGPSRRSRPDRLPRRLSEGAPILFLRLGAPSCSTRGCRRRTRKWTGTLEPLSADERGAAQPHGAWRDDGRRGPESWRPPRQPLFVEEMLRMPDDDLCPGEGRQEAGARPPTWPCLRRSTLIGAPRSPRAGERADPLALSSERQGAVAELSTHEDRAVGITPDARSEGAIRPEDRGCRARTRSVHLLIGRYRDVEAERADSTGFAGWLERVAADRIGVIRGGDRLPPTAAWYGPN
jgi:hypothetical protein